MTQPSAVGRRSPLTWLLFALTAVGIVLALIENAVLLIAGGGAGLLTLLAWVAFTALAITGLVFAHGRPHLGRGIVVAAVAWGAAAFGYSQHLGPVIRNFWRSIFGASFDSSGWADALTAPINEETLKAVGVVLILLALPRLRSSFEGFFIGALIGVGFLFLESLFYTIAVISQSGDLRLIPVSLGLRGVLEGLAGHPAFTAIIGAAIGHLFAAKRKGLAALVLIGAVAVVLVLHGLFDADPIPDSVRWVTGSLTLLIALAAWWYARRVRGRESEPTARL